MKNPCDKKCPFVIYCATQKITQIDVGICPRCKEGYIVLFRKVGIPSAQGSEPIFLDGLGLERKVDYLSIEGAPDCGIIKKDQDFCDGCRDELEIDLADESDERDALRDQLKEVPHLLRKIGETDDDY